VAFGYLLQVAVTAGGGEMPTVQQAFRDFASDPVAAPIFVVGAVLLAPLGEELLFRGMLFQSVRARLGTWPGVGISAIAFALVHVGPTASAAGNVLTFTTIFALGMFLAWMFHRTGSIVVPILAHCTFNAISATLLVATVG
jgi:membrane protease YdiL (CAAX protease family)